MLIPTNLNANDTFIMKCIIYSTNQSHALNGKAETLLREIALFRFLRSSSAHQSTLYMLIEISNPLTSNPSKDFLKETSFTILTVERYSLKVSNTLEC